MKTQKISHKPRRWDQDNSIYFLTFCTFDRDPCLHDDQVAELVVENLHFYAQRLRELIAYTVMPDHVHLLVSVERVEHMSNYLRDFKKRTAKEIKALQGLDLPHIWQRGTMDHCIRVTPANEDYVNHIQYIFYNSMKHLGIIPKGFPFHNFKEAVEKGWIEEDFGSTLPRFPKQFDMYE